jgi:hypothetical protein
MLWMTCCEIVAILVFLVPVGAVNDIPWLLGKHGFLTMKYIKKFSTDSLGVDASIFSELT